MCIRDRPIATQKIRTMGMSSATMIAATIPPAAQAMKTSSAYPVSYTHLFLEERKLEKESNVSDKRVTLKNEAQSAKTASMELSSRYCENHNRDQQR